jgi:hypothetical protein
MGVTTYAAAGRLDRMEHLKAKGVRRLKLDLTDEMSIMSRGRESRSDRGRHVINRQFSAVRLRDQVRASRPARLVFLLAAKHPQDVKALLAFSPGEYLASPSSVRSAAAQLSIPIFVTSAKGAGKWRRGRRFWTQLRRGKRFNSCHTSPASTAHRPCGLIEIRKAPPRIGPPLKLFWPRSRFEGNGGAD